MKRLHLNQLLVFLFILMATVVRAQEIPSNEVLSINQLSAFLKKEIRVELEENGKLSNAKLAAYFRQKFTERFFYDHEAFSDRLIIYNDLYDNQDDHESRARDHLHKYADSTQWVLPFNYQTGEAVNAYALRHLARQHKMVDIALYYFHSGKDPKYIQYFENQMRSLNAALSVGAYEKIEDGNGVYEVFRSGYRILNWLWIHNMFLKEAEYTDEDQLYTIATLLQHAQHLYERNSKFRSGNHQTRGMSALAQLSILLRDFEGTDKWYELAMARLAEHLDKEINPDGFQFERSVHYHMSDINNYFYVYQLAKISEVAVDKAWEDKLRALFTTLTQIAYPDKSAPVLQDDTEIPWAEKNDISGVMTLGYLLFEDPKMGYFASNRVSNSMYWFLSNAQVEMLKNIKEKKPKYGSLIFPHTHYYIMREGWSKNDKMMIISAGLDSKKPDHQHGDMLGIQAFANQQVILPNYQVRYSLKDFDLFKNSMVKNVALVDDEVQGKQWTSNKGGSGFGKFKDLPQPTVIGWESNDAFDLFVGSHDGFENIGVKYSRQVIFIKDNFWMVKDNFSSKDKHEYKQVWQGHYTDEVGPNLIRATFPDASGVDILQLNPIDSTFSDGARGKNWTITSKKDQENFSFITAIFPYRGYNNRIDELNKPIELDEWIVNDPRWKAEGHNLTSISKGNEAYFFGLAKLTIDQFTIKASSTADLHLQKQNGKLKIYSLGTQKLRFTVYNGQNKAAVIKELKPGESFEFKS